MCGSTLGAIAVSLRPYTTAKKDFTAGSVGLPVGSRVFCPSQGETRGSAQTVLCPLPGLAYPCHPYCVKALELSPVKTAEAAREQVKLERRERVPREGPKKRSVNVGIKKNQKSDECLVYDGFRISLAIFLTVHVMLGKSAPPPVHGRLLVSNVSKLISGSRSVRRLGGFPQSSSRRLR